MLTLPCPIYRTRKVKDTDATWSSKSKSKSDDKEMIIQSQPSNSGRGGAVPDGSRGPYIQRINNDAREDEMEENMQAVGGILGNLKNMAADMGDEIGRQNKQLDRINAKVCVPRRFLIAYYRSGQANWDFLLWIFTLQWGNSAIFLVLRFYVKTK